MNSLSLTKKQFDVLVAMEETEGKVSQREISEMTGHGLGTINKVLKELTEMGCVSNGTITSKEYLLEVLDSFLV